MRAADTFEEQDEHEEHDSDVDGCGLRVANGLDQQESAKKFVEKDHDLLLLRAFGGEFH